MTGNDNEGSQSVYGSDVEIVTSSAAIPTSATASNKVRSIQCMCNNWKNFFPGNTCSIFELSVRMFQVFVPYLL